MILLNGLKKIRLILIAGSELGKVLVLDQEI